MALRVMANCLIGWTALLNSYFARGRNLLEPLCHFDLRGEALTARAVGNCVWVGDFESALLKVIAEIEFRSAHEKCAFGINQHSYFLAFYEDVPICRTISKIHFILKPGAPSTNHRNAQRTLGTSLFFQETTEFPAGRLGNANQLFVANAVLDIAFGDQ